MVEVFAAGASASEGKLGDLSRLSRKILAKSNVDLTSNEIVLIKNHVDVAFARRCCTAGSTTFLRDGQQGCRWMSIKTLRPLPPFDRNTSTRSRTKFCLIQAWFGTRIRAV